MKRRYLSAGSAGVRCPPIKGSDDLVRADNRGVSERRRGDTKKGSKPTETQTHSYRQGRLPPHASHAVPQGAKQRL